MFEITSDQVIKIHKGDDSGEFPLFINQGSKLQPIQYKFYPELSITDYPDNSKVTIDSDIFYTKISSDGFYDFEYNYLYDEKGEKIGELGWYLNSLLVDLNDYGITLDITPSIKDHITVAVFKDNPSEVYFYILDLYTDLDQALVKKTFSSNGNITTEFNNCNIYTNFEETTTVNDDNNMVLSFNPDDTKYLMSGEYCYQIKAKLYDLEKDKYIYNTITNRLPLYIVDGEDSEIW